MKLRQRGCTRSISGLYRFLCKNGRMAAKPSNLKHIPKSCKQMDYPGQRVRINVKFVRCLACKAAQEEGYFHDTFPDEYICFRYLGILKTQHLEHVPRLAAHSLLADFPLHN